MNRVLLALFVAASVTAACSGGGESTSGATVSGRVQTEFGIGLDGASVQLDGASTTTDDDGAFELGSKAGTRTLDVEADGYRRVTADVRVAGGDNRIEVTMVPCTAGVDAGCATPTASPSPSPTPNVSATFGGTAADVPTNSYQAWAGSAVLDGASLLLGLGEDAESFLLGGSDLAFSACWEDAGETTSYDGVGTPDHCVFWWDGDEEGATFPDAIFYVSIPGSEWMEGVPNLITFGDGMTAGYYEGTLGLPLQISDYTLLNPAVEGTLVLAENGSSFGQPVSISGQATFRIPTLP